MLSAKRAEALLTEVGALYSIVLGIARGAESHDQALTATQRLVLIEVGDAGRLRPRHLAQLLHTTPATITRAVQVLEELGLVVRKPDPADGRCLLVVATPAGRRWVRRRGDRVRKAIQRIPPSAAPSRLVQDLSRLNDALRAASGDRRAGRNALRRPPAT
jgi:DNA-binding MarR family transcriptional regulator